MSGFTNSMIATMSKNWYVMQAKNNMANNSTIE